MSPARSTSPSPRGVRASACANTKAAGFAALAFVSLLLSAASADPAAEAYRRAQVALDRAQYREAAEAFERLYEEHPTSTYAPNAPYWRAFALSRAGGVESLDAALRALELQSQLFPQAATAGDATTLAIRIDRELARMGDASAAARVALRGAALSEAMAAEEALAQARTTPATPPAPRAPVASPRGVPATPPTPHGLLTPPPGVPPTGMLGAPTPSWPGPMLGFDVGAWNAAPLASLSALADVRVGLDDTRVALADARAGIGHSGIDDSKAMALAALMESRPERALPIVQKLLAKRDAESAPLRQRAVFLLGQHGDEESAPILLDAARNDPDENVRADAVFWLGQVGGDSTVDLLASLARDGSSPRVQERAAFSLSQHESERAGAVLRELATDKTVGLEVREQALFWLGQRPDFDDPGHTFLKDLFDASTEESLRQRIFQSLAEHPSPETTRWLLERAGDSSLPLSLRAQALFWACTSGDVPAAQLVTLYRTSPDRELREQVLLALSQSSEPAAIDALLSIARTETDPELRHRAVFWLGQTDDPRADELLEEILLGE